MYGCQRRSHQFSHAKFIQFSELKADCKEKNSNTACMHKVQSKWSTFNFHALHVLKEHIILMTESQVFPQIDFSFLVTEEIFKEYLVHGKKASCAEYNKRKK